MTEEREPDGWIITSTGRKFWPVQPRAEDVLIDDIAHALAQCARYAGHAPMFYSVAEHSIYVSRWVLECGLVIPRLRLFALLHDAAEAYLGDMTRPLKRRMPQYREVEDRVMACVWDRFGFTATEIDRFTAPTKIADGALLATERCQFFKDKHPIDWTPPGRPIDQYIACMPWEIARAAFLERFYELGGK